MDLDDETNVQEWYVSKQVEIDEAFGEAFANEAVNGKPPQSAKINEANHYNVDYSEDELMWKTMAVCEDCGYSLNKWEFDSAKGRLMFCEGTDIEEGEYRCGRCDERCGDPEGMFPNDDDNDAT